MTPLPAQPAPKTKHISILPKCISKSFFYLIDEVPGIAGAFIGQNYTMIFYFFFHLGGGCSHISKIRLLFMRDEEELTSLAVVFVELFRNDLESLRITFNKAFIQNTGVEAFMCFIKKKITATAHAYLTDKQMNHSKVRDIKYEKLETQPYLTSNLFCDKETKLLTALRSRMNDSLKKISVTCMEDILTVH